MATLSNDTLIAIEVKILDFKRDPKLVPYGYPVSLVSDLLETIQYQKKLKKRYQRSASEKSQCLLNLFSIISREIDKTTEVLES
jgi:hypothetical protein